MMSITHYSYYTPMIRGNTIQYSLKDFSEIFLILI